MKSQVEYRIEDLEDNLNAQLASLTWTLMVAMLLSADGALLKRVGKGNIPTAVSFGSEGPWLFPREGLQPLIQKSRPQCSCASLQKALATDEELSPLLNKLGRQRGIEAQAEHLLRPVLSDCALTTQQQMEDIEFWAPILERGAFSANCTLQLLLEACRPDVVDSLANPSAPPIQRILYWGRVRLMGRLALLGMSPDSDWLRRVKKNYVWKAWTPSKPLLKERSLWMALIAARAAAAFGGQAIDAYESILQNPVLPMDALDAVFGLTAIGYSVPNARLRVTDAILRSADNARTSGGVYLTEMARTQALAMLRQPDQWRHKSEKHWLCAPNLELSSRRIVMADPFAVAPDGSWEALLAIPIGVSVSPPQLFPDDTDTSDVLNHGDVDSLLARAWTDTSPVASATIH